NTNCDAASRVSRTNSRRTRDWRRRRGRYDGKLEYELMRTVYGASEWCKGESAVEGRPHHFVFLTLSFSLCLRIRAATRPSSCNDVEFRQTGPALLCDRE